MRLKTRVDLALLGLVLMAPAAAWAKGGWIEHGGLQKGGWIEHGGLGYWLQTLEAWFRSLAG